MYSKTSTGNGQISGTSITGAKPRYNFREVMLASRQLYADPRYLATSQPTLLTLWIDDERVPVDPQSLLTDDGFTELLERCQDAYKPVTIELNRLLWLNARERVALFDFVASLDHKPRFIVGVAGEAVTDLLSAVLALMPPSDDRAGLAEAKQAAFEVAVLFHPNVLETACSQIQLRMRELGIKGVRLDRLIGEARLVAKRLDEATQDTDEEPQRTLVCDVLADAPVPAEAVVPVNWTLDEAGIQSRREGATDTIPAPVVILGRGRDSAKGTEHLSVAWFRSGQWHRRIVERETVASTQKVVALAAFGFPVNSNNAKLVVQYLADFEAENLEHLPLANVTRKLGYQGPDGELGFLWGKQLITANGVLEGESWEQGQAESGSSRSVHFQGADDGDEQLAAGFHAAGSYADWCRAVSVIEGFPKVRLALYSALAAPLLQVLKAPNIIVDLAGETTGGKTVALRVAASCFGNPDEQGANGQPAAIATWGGTSVWKERAPAVMNNLPFILDDTKHSRNADDVSKTLYQIAQGRSLGRGTVKGTAGQETFSTVMLSSGEQPATSFTQDGGTRGRVIELWDSPFGKKNQETGQLVRRLNDGVKRNYGQAGPQFIQYIFRNRQHWGEWRERYSNWILHWEEQAANNRLAGRLAASFATLSLTAELVHEALDLPWDYSEPVAPVWEEIVREASDRASAALLHALSWANSHVAEFFGRRESAFAPPAQGWAGRWDIDTGPGALEPQEAPERYNWRWIGFHRVRLDVILKEGGFEPESTVRAWRDRGWLELEKEGGTSRTQKKVRVGEDTVRLVVIPAEAFDAAEKAE